MTGIFGSAGKEIDRLGFLLIKPFKTSNINSLRWPQINSSTGTLKPNIRTIKLCNDTSLTQHQSYTFVKSKGED